MKCFCRIQESFDNEIFLVGFKTLTMVHEMFFIGFKILLMAYQMILVGFKALMMADRRKFRSETSDNMDS